MIKKLLHPPRSLDGKMLYMLLLSFLCAGIVYLGTYRLASWALTEIYMSPESRAARQAEIYSEFYQFVTGSQIKGDNTEAIARWTREHPYVTILVYPNETQGINPSQSMLPAAGQPAGAAPYSGIYGRLYPMRFADGVYRIAIGDSSNVREDNINRILSVILGSITFILIMFWYIRRLTNRIIRLSREADVIGAGDLEAPITVKGEDELAMLAAEMDSMRRSVIERMSGERRAWEANSELITAISHDIRTPMTALIGYLSLLNKSSLDDRESTRQFISSASDKAMELKDLTDELFKYFLVFGRAELELNLEDFDARLLLEQLLGEAEFDLLDAGFRVEHIGSVEECKLRTDPLYLKRVVDNLVSNAKKYADRSEPITLDLEVGEFLTVRMRNRIARNGPRVESTKIGLRTCEKILSSLGGEFRTDSDGEYFNAAFSLPIQ